MFLEGTRSWRVSSGDSHHVDVALYVRDALALSVETRPHIPSLDPSVPIFIPDGIDRAAVTAEWPGWWETVLEWPRTEVSAEQELTFGPSFDTSPALANRPALRAAIAALTEPGGMYRSAAARGLTRPSSMPIGEVVSELAKELGRPVRPFNLEITQISVAEPMWELLTESHVLASYRFTESSAVVPALREVISRLAWKAAR
ncbi:hypothetical protein LWC34_28065 [Kibdelosporangium philippinense]|uniref:LysR substrate-binding domain-containing protein n=1 Tax=Kibdelosporangium philippinense TaxID=211113 RepID=A0ABS8ZJ41_9PSEU|nr:hypothetical protein [Kibdelosporangium philippinense]MCE7006656.1 hypothetical protein [Kibdelosporangium philippinense]